MALMQSVYLTESNWLERLSHTGTERKKIHKPPHTQKDKETETEVEGRERQRERMTDFIAFINFYLQIGLYNRGTRILLQYD